jgi:replicative superfamily II helicase
VAATTSLKMGVNFPVTDVVIRDVFIRSKRGTFTISASDVTQMMGRAGRGDVPGRALILSRSEELTHERASQLSSGLVETLKPRLIPVRSSHRKKSEAGSELNPISGVVLTQIVVQQTAKVEDIVDFLNHSFSAQQTGFSTWDSRESLDFLLRNHLVEPDEGVDGAFRARPLGKTIAFCGISPESGAILAGMLRALMSLQRKTKENGEKAEDLIARLTALDFLFLAISTYECRDYWLKKSDVEAMISIEGYIERLSVDEKPLFNRWRRAEDEKYPTRRLLSTLKVEFEDNATVVEKFNRIMATAILMHRHAKGESLGSLSRSYSAGKRMLHEGDLENGLKYTAIWILSCLSKICDPEKAYDMERVKFRILDLIEDVSLGSEMGKLTTKPGIGPKTVRKLIDAGITSVNCLQTGTVEKLKTCGLSKRQIAVLQSKTLRRRR